jgi:5-methylcytosine-specific restriction endonuclease McrA
MPMEQVLLLNNDYNFLTFLNWKRAVTLVVTGKVEVLKTTDRMIRSAGNTVNMYLPSVIRLVKLTKRMYRARVPYSKYNVLVRDKHRCQYCGKQLTPNNATVDHIIPSSRGGKTSFENCITSCKPCNNLKDDRLPDECGMYPKCKPYTPTVAEFVRLKRKSLGVDELLEKLNLW